MRRCQWHRNLFVITAKTITPSFAPWSTPPFRVCQSDRVPPILTACYRLVRKAAIHFRRTGWISSLASSSVVWSIKCSSLRKHPFLPALRRWGRFLLSKRSQRRRVRRNGCFRRLSEFGPWTILSIWWRHQNAVLAQFLRTFTRPKILSQFFCIRLFGPLSPSSPERGQTEFPFKAIRNGVG